MVIQSTRSKTDSALDIHVERFYLLQGLERVFIEEIPSGILLV